MRAVVLPKSIQHILLLEAVNCTTLPIINITLSHFFHTVVCHTIVYTCYIVTLGVALM